jgi:hypothetical protein
MGTYFEGNLEHLGQWAATRCHCGPTSMLCMCDDGVCGCEPCKARRKMAAAGLPIPEEKYPHKPPCAE